MKGLLKMRIKQIISMDWFSNSGKITPVYKQSLNNDKFRLAIGQDFDYAKDKLEHPTFILNALIHFIPGDGVKNTIKSLTEINEAMNKGVDDNLKQKIVNYAQQCDDYLEQKVKDFIKGVVDRTNWNVEVKK